ncbi:MAG: cytochrome c biogenesis heme-transporting ATPase CcmA [Gammaproteobacteria bacterium]|nr:cytochrome c biogenesis heme-transporting ATPase CcmA [Gammaproteobacteria bacterium]
MLEITDLAVSRGNRLLLEGLTLRLAPGELALITGPNGAGKTSLLRVVAGLSQAAAGRLCWQARALQTGDPEYAQMRIYLGHQAGLKADLSVTENLRFLVELQNHEFHSDKLAACLASLGLAGAEDRPVRALSAGQRRRVALARLRLTAARLWVLDEPLTNLDVDGQALITGWLGEHLRTGGMAMIASHAPLASAAPGRCVQVELGT